jgi:hypothetical protein
MVTLLTSAIGGGHWIGSTPADTSRRRDFFQVAQLQPQLTANLTRGVLYLPDGK